MTWACFWMEETEFAEFGLRRYHAEPNQGGWTCEQGYHTAFVWLGIRMPRGREASEGGSEYYGDPERLYPVPEDDDRWPTQCSTCDYQFTEDDRRQVWAEQVFDTPHGEMFSRSAMAPHDTVQGVRPGACQHIWWYVGGPLNPDRPKDGIVLGVHCPRLDREGETSMWVVDQPSTRSGGYWTRTPVDKTNITTLTVNPSIAINPPGSPSYYHGFLHNGVLTDHLG